MTQSLTYRCLDHPDSCEQFDVSTDADEPLFCPYCGNQSVVPLGSSKYDWEDGVCPHCGDDAEFYEDIGIWRWTATCDTCNAGHAIMKPLTER